MRHAAYLRALFDEQLEQVTMRQIRSSDRDVFSVEFVKIGLSPYGDKRYVLDDRVSTLAFDHHRICNSDHKVNSPTLGPPPPSPPPSHPPSPPPPPTP